MEDKAAEWITRTLFFTTNLHYHRIYSNSRKLSATQVCPAHATTFQIPFLFLLILTPRSRRSRSSHGAIPGDMPSLSATIAGLGLFFFLTSLGTVLGDVSKLATAVTLYGVSLTVARKVVIASTLVAHDTTCSSKMTSASTATSTSSTAPTATAATTSRP